MLVESARNSSTTESLV